MSSLVLELKDVEQHWQISKASDLDTAHYVQRPSDIQSRLEFENLTEAIKWALSKMGRLND